MAAVKSRLAWLRRIWARARRLLGRLRALAVRVWRIARPGTSAWKGGAVGVSLAAFALVLGLVGEALTTTSARGLAVVLLTALVLASFLIGGLLCLLLSLLNRLPLPYRWAVLASLPILVLLGGFAGGPAVAIVPLAILVPASLAGAGAAVLIRRSAETPARTRVGAAGLVVGALSLALTVFWLLGDGPGEEPLVSAALESAVSVATIQLPNPGASGLHAVRHLTYGSGTDRHRPEYGEDVEIRTEPVDGGPFIDGWDGLPGWIRDRYWGFSVDELPRNGRVWYPDGDGPFPLVLVVHGNHSAEDFSDPGYEYLGELLASRGFILVSVDENFLNSGIGDLFSGLETENDARGWMLLEHLRLWREWNRDTDSRFFGKVDLDRIGLIGHSRGGEAVSEAAAFNRLAFYPDDATVSFDYGFNIGAVVAIAPVDDQYSPTGIPTPVQDVSYLVLHGSHDGDVSSFDGLGTWERVRFEDEAYRFKSALYIHGANHGQFNTTWGRSDVGWLLGRFMNLAPIMPAESQRQIAKVYIGAFLEAALHEKRGYLPLFRDSRTGADWLPSGVYLLRFEDSTYTHVATFEEDIDVTSTTLAGGRVEGSGLSVWREELLTGKWDQSLSSSAVFLGWHRDDAHREDAEPQENTGSVASYAITLPPRGPEHALRTGAHQVLSFDLADANEEPDPDAEEEDSESDSGNGANDSDSDEEDSDRAPIDLTVELEDADGHLARLPLSHFSLLQTQIEVQLRKASFMNAGPASEIVLQTFEIGLADFSAVEGDFDPAALETIRFVFDRTEEGVVVLDNVALREILTEPSGPSE